MNTTALLHTPRKKDFDRQMLSDYKDTLDQQRSINELKRTLEKTKERYEELRIKNDPNRLKKEYTPVVKERRNDFYNTAMKNIMSEMKELDNRFYSEKKGETRERINKEREQYGLPLLSQKINLKDDFRSSPNLHRKEQSLIRYEYGLEGDDALDQFKNTQKSEIRIDYSTDKLTKNKHTYSTRNVYGKPEYISEFNPTYTDIIEQHRDRIDHMRDRKFQEHKERFERFVTHRLPEEINGYLHDFFDNNIRQFKKDLAKENDELGKHVSELHKFSKNMEEGKKRAKADLNALKRELALVQRNNLERRRDLYEAVQRTDFYGEKDSYKKDRELRNYLDRGREIDTYLRDIQINKEPYAKREQQHKDRRMMDILHNMDDILMG